MRLFIFGAGQIATVAGLYFSETKKYSQIFYVVDEGYLNQDFDVDGPIISWREAQEEALATRDLWFTAISFKNRNKLRADVASRIAKLGYSFASYIHPTATCSRDFRIQPNSMIMENNVFQVRTSLGANSIVWSNNHVGHHTTIGENAFIASEVCISGSCEIGVNSFFGVNSTVIDNLKIGNNVIIGAGALITKSVEDDSVVRGNSST